MRRKGRPLPDLADYEDQLLEIVVRCRGDAAMRDRTLERNGVYKNYAGVLATYVHLGGDGVEGSEALRRATFLLWCSQTLPASLTGVAEVPQQMEDALIGMLDRVARDRLDPQLRWMLCHYHARCPIVFDRHPWADHLHTVLASGRGDAWRDVEPEIRDFERRGLMGRYWSQVISAG